MDMAANGVRLCYSLTWHLSEIESMQKLREFLENRQISVYFATVTLAAVIAMFVPGTTVLEAGVNPALALMLFVTFLQVPLCIAVHSGTYAQN